MRLKNKTVLITGGAGGIGAASAVAMVAEGAQVVIADIDETAGTRLASSIGPATCFHRVDVRHESEADGAVAFATAKFGRLDILVNNAGGGKLGPSDQVSWARWRQTMDLNLDGMFLMARAALRHMLEAGGGAIVNMASVHGLVGFPEHMAYTAAKGAVVNMTRALGVEYASRNIRVNAVCPGFVNTQLIATEVKPADLPPMIALHPMGRMAEPSEVAAAVVFLASDEASFITGACLPVDGGYTAH